MPTKRRGASTSKSGCSDNWLKQFTIAFGTDEGDDTTTFNGTIPQTLMMFNGDLIRQATTPKEGGFLYQLANNSKMNNADAH